jgi:acyl-CoA thioesterase FadM
VIHLGSRTATAEGRIVDADGKLYAHGSTTCIVVDAGKKKPKTLRPPFGGRPAEAGRYIRATQRD